MALHLPIHLGCPAWSVAEWKGNFLPAKLPADQFLFHYSCALSSVEGNTTFYALPKLETARRWAREVSPGFHFCFKVPRDVSHAGGLMANPTVLRAFLRMLEEFACTATLGPAYLQLSDAFSPSRLSEIDNFCKSWPTDFPLAVEVRHQDFFSGGQAQDQLENLLQNRGVDRVIFDSRALFQAPPTDATEVQAQARKPSLPVHWTTTGHRPMVRFVSGNQLELSDPWLRDVAAVLKGWLAEGKHPYVFMHTADRRHGPFLCERFYRHLQNLLPNLTPLDLLAAKGGQGELF